MHIFYQFPIMLSLTSATKEAETLFVQCFVAIQQQRWFGLVLSFRLGRCESCVSELLSDLF